MGACDMGKMMKAFKDWNEQWLETQSDERYKTRRVKMFVNSVWDKLKGMH